MKISEKIQSLRDTDTMLPKINVVSQSKEEQQAEKFLESTIKFTCERYEVGRLCSKPEPNLPINYSSALGPLYSLEWKF